jgi:hypothetical protein
MSKKRYPYLSSKEHLRGSGGSKCACCEAKATRKIEVQISWFRGDDEVYRVCENHIPGNSDWSDFYNLLVIKKRRSHE